MIDPAEFSAYVASRICHDLVSPVSSITHSLELIDDPSDPEMQKTARELLEQGAESASIRLQFLRYAFGSLGMSDGAADIHEAKTVTEKFVSTHKPSITWDIETGHLSFSHARLMMNLVMLGVQSLPRGGVIAVRIRNEQGGMTITVTSEGTRAKLQEETAHALAGQEPEMGWSSRNVQPLFTRVISEGLGAELSAHQNEEQVILMAQGIRAEG
ncbi:MAG: histidine phosphotransferase family protein [Pseudomonadota bacterium]